MPPVRRPNPAQMAMLRRKLGQGAQAVRNMAGNAGNAIRNRMGGQRAAPMEGQRGARAGAMPGAESPGGPVRGAIKKLLRVRKETYEERRRIAAERYTGRRKKIVDHERLTIVNMALIYELLGLDHAAISRIAKALPMQREELLKMEMEKLMNTVKKIKISNKQERDNFIKYIEDRYTENGFSEAQKKEAINVFIDLCFQSGLIEIDPSGRPQPYSELNKQTVPLLRDVSRRYRLDIRRIAAAYNITLTTQSAQSQ